MGIYLVKRYHHVDSFRQYDLRRQNLVALHDEDPDSPINTAEIDIPKTGDWLVEYDETNSRLIIMVVDKYVYLPRKHLYVKHFAKLKASYEKSAEDEDIALLDEIMGMDHLQVFHESVSKLMDKYQKLFLNDFIANMSKQEQREAYKRIKQYAAEKAAENRVVELVDPSKITGAISKATLETYIQKHNGKLPTKTEFDKLTKQFMSSSGRRKRRH